MLSIRCSRCSAFRSSQISSAIRSAFRATFSTTAVNQLGYDDTINNLKIGKDTRVIFQGFTGKQATANAQESIAWGTQIVGGVRPGKSGEHLGLPVLPNVRDAMALLKPDATGIYVAGHLAVGAIEEAIEAEVPLIVVVAEHIPLHDMLRVSSFVVIQFASSDGVKGAFHAPVAVQVTSRRSKCTWHHLSHWPLPHWIPTLAMLY